VDPTINKKDWKNLYRRFFILDYLVYQDDPDCFEMYVDEIWKAKKQ